MRKHAREIEEKWGGRTLVIVEDLTDDPMLRFQAELAAHARCSGAGREALQIDAEFRLTLAGAGVAMRFRIDIRIDTQSGVYDCLRVGY